MSNDAGTEHVSKKRVVYNLAGADAVDVRRDLPFQSADGADLFLDLYQPSRSATTKPPVVVIVAGYPDPGFEKAVGCRFKDMGSSDSWGRLCAASGIAAVTYTNRDPARDVATLINHLRTHESEFGIDADRIGLWASSGNAPLALSVLTDAQERIKCAALCYPLTLDLDGGTEVSAAAAMFHFAQPATATIAGLPRRVPLFVARAGQDQFAGLNRALDRFIAHALGANLPITVVNYAEAPHAFDLFMDTEASRHVVRQVLAFMVFHLDGRTGAPV